MTPDPLDGLQEATTMVFSAIISGASDDPSVRSYFEAVRDDWRRGDYELQDMLFCLRWYLSNHAGCDSVAVRRMVGDLEALMDE